MSGPAPTLSSLSGDGTWTHPGGCYAYVASIANDMSDCAYRLSLTGSATSITVTLSESTAGVYVEFLEIKKSTMATFSFDAAGNTTSLGCVKCQAPSLSLTGTLDYIAQASTPCLSVEAITGGDIAGFQSPADFNAAGNFGVAGAENATNGTGPQWIQAGASGQCLAMSGVALK